MSPPLWVWVGTEAGALGLQRTGLRVLGGGTPRAHVLGTRDPVFPDPQAPLGLFHLVFLLVFPLSSF